MSAIFFCRRRLEKYRDFPIWRPLYGPTVREIHQVIKKSENNKKRPELGISYQGVRAGYMRRNAFYRSFIKTSREAFFDFLFFRRFSWVKYFHIRFTGVQWDYLINCTIQCKEIPCTSWKLTWKYLTHKKHLKNSKFRKIHDGCFFVSIMRYCVPIFSSKLSI